MTRCQVETISSSAAAGRPTRRAPRRRSHERPTTEIVQLYLQIDRGISAADLDTKAQLVTKANVGNIGKRFEN